MTLGLDIKASSLQVTSLKALPAADLADVKDIAAVPVEFKVDPEATFLLTHTYGGRWVTASSGASPCTTGFTIRHTGTGVRGVTTAGHCGNTGLVYNDAYYNTYELTHYGERFDDDQDAQWMVNQAHISYARYFDGSAYRSVNSVANGLYAWIGTYVCHYGVTTGRSCGEVADVSFSPGYICGPSGSNLCYPSWVKVVEPAGGNLVCNFGDSGGPWFSGGIAYGIQQAGGAPLPDCDQATFMQHNFFGLMSLAVLTE